MSKSPCGRNLHCFCLLIVEWFKYCLRQLLIIQIKKYSHGYLFGVALNSETRDLVTQQVLNLSALVGIEIDRKVVVGCIMLSIYDAVESIPAMFNLAPMSLVSLCQPIIIIIQRICSPILKEVIVLSLSQTRHILLLGVGEFEVPDA